MTNESKVDFVKSVIEDFNSKKIPFSKSSLTKYLMNKYPSKFKNYETSRSMVRYATGNQGDASRKNSNVKMYTINDLPESHSEPWNVFIIDQKKFPTILNLSDVHIPYHNKYALDAAINYGIVNKAKLCLLNGDFLDMFQLSVYEKRPDKPSVSLEFEMARDIIAVLRKTFKNILFKTGNHEQRFERFLLANPSIFDVPEFQLAKVLRLSDSEYITDKRIIKAGKLNILHGHELGRDGMFSPVNFARTLSLKLGESCIAGHVHQTSEHSFTRVGGDMITCWSQGHLAEEHPQYRPVNQWNHGFSFIDIEKDGTFHVHNKRIKNGKVY